MTDVAVRLAITGWGVISPIGIGRDQFTHGFASRQSGRKPVDGFGDRVFPFDSACTVPDFETTRFLGSKGTRSMDRTTGMAVTAVGMALEHSNVGTETDRSRIGVVLGTSTGSIKSISDFTRETLVQERPYLVNPALFPNTVMNCAAGQCAIWHRLTGVNATISGGHASGVLALRYAALAIRQGYADSLLTGAVEEFCEQAAWAYSHMRLSAGYDARPLGEGCAMFVVENLTVAQAHQRKVLAEVLACEVGVYPPYGDNRQPQVEGLATCIQRALLRGRVAASAVGAVSLGQYGQPVLDQVERDGVRLGLQSADPPNQFAISELVGESFSASGVLQLAALLALHEKQQPDSAHRYGLLTSLTSDGTVGCVLLRMEGA